MKLTPLKALRASWKPFKRASDDKFGLAAELIPSRSFTRANMPKRRRSRGFNRMSSPEYHYCPAKSPQSAAHIMEFREKALDKAIRRGVPHQLGKFSKKIFAD